MDITDANGKIDNKDVDSSVISPISTTTPGDKSYIVDIVKSQKQLFKDHLLCFPNPYSPKKTNLKPKVVYCVWQILSTISS